MNVRTVIIRIFIVIGLLGTLLVDELWKRAAYLIMFTMFFHLDCERYFKKKFANPKINEEGKGGNVI